MDKWLKSPWFVRIVSLVLAILLYTAVSLDVNTAQSDPTFIPNGSNELETMNNVPVDIKIDEEKYVVSGVPQTVTVAIEGSKSMLTPTVRQKNFSVFVDLQRLEPGTHQVNIQHTGISDELSVYIEPKMVEVTIEERSTQAFNVNIDFINQDKIVAGYELGEAVITPKQVSITSSKGVVESAAIVKAFVDVTGVEESIDSREVPVKVYDSQGNELNVRVEPATVAVSVEVINPNKTVPVEAVTKGELQEGLTLESITVEPKELKVFAGDETLAALNQLKTEEIDLSKIEDTTTVDVPLQLSDNIRKVEQKSVKVTIKVAQREEKVFDNLQIETRNLNEAYSATFQEPNNGLIDVTVIGTKEELKNLTAEDISLSIDLNEKGPGEYEVPIKIDGPDEISYKAEVERAIVRIE
jgi:YbbR domain-containing protein